jgi:hypothetical protein
MSSHLKNFCDTKREEGQIFLSVMVMSISSQGNGCLSLTIGNVSCALPITHVTWNGSIGTGEYLKKKREAVLLKVMTSWIILFKTKNSRETFSNLAVPLLYMSRFLVIFLAYSSNFSSSYKHFNVFLDISLTAK